MSVFAVICNDLEALCSFWPVATVICSDFAEWCAFLLLFVMILPGAMSHSLEFALPPPRESRESCGCSKAKSEIHRICWNEVSGLDLAWL